VVVYTLHGRDPWWPAPDGSSTVLRDAMPSGLRAFLALERALRPATDRFVAVSPTVARDAVVARVATPGKVDVAASAVELDIDAHEPSSAVRSMLGVPDGAPLIGTVGRLDAQKAPLDFVRMAAAVARARPGARFVMVGDGELAGDAARLAAELGAPVLFTGQRPDATRIIAALDVFVISSLYEGVGRALTEAMAAARPVVSTAVDGVVDVVAPGATGLLAPPRDPDALAERVLWMLDHPAAAASMGVQARARVRELFSPERMCATLDEVYSAALGLVPLPAGAAEPPVRLSELALTAGGAG
jgi:glycosyltransferase involved in cell wall biosynthesis